MENQKDAIKKIAFNYGIIWGLLSIVLSVIAYVTDDYIERPMWLTIAGLAIMAGIIVYGLKAFKTENEGYLSVSEALKVGLAISLIAAIIGAIYNYIFITVIEPDYVIQMLEFSTEQMVIQNPDMTQEQMDMATGITEKMMTPSIMTAMGIIIPLFLGFITSLIAGLIMKVNRPEN
jgi:Na+-transporting NADH:ubiquinone oxidoreductase subunit NqrE